MPRTSTTTTALVSVRALCDCGVAANVAHRLAADHPPELIDAWTDYAASQQGMGPGALIQGIRSGGLPPQPTRQRTVLEEQAEYGRSIQAWLARCFPELDRPGWGPHPAAIAEVIRLHWRHGKGRLTKEE